MWHHLILLWLACAAASAPAYAQASKPVALGNTSAMRSGTLLREKRELRVDEGRTRQEFGANITDVSTRYLQRVNWVRRVLGSGTEEIQVRELLKECVHFTGAPPPPNEAPMFASKILRARKMTGRWNFSLSQGKTTPEEARLLEELAFAADLLEILPVCIGTGSHKEGDTWKTEIPAPRGKAYGWIVPDSLESTLVAVEDKADGQHATVTIAGKFHMERPMNLNARMEVAFTATVVRRLSDMLDVDTKITGQFVASAQSAGPNREKILLSYDYPFTLTRTLSIEPK